MASSVKDGCEREEDLLDDLLHKVIITIIVTTTRGFEMKCHFPAHPLHANGVSVLQCKYITAILVAEFVLTC